MCFLFNKNRCSDIRITSQGSTSNLEFITNKCLPFYLPHDITSVMSTAVYIHPCSDTNAAAKALHNTICMCENNDPNTLSIVADFLPSKLGQHNA